MGGNRETLVKMLKEIGLTDLEGVIYIWLLEHERSTGYKIASGVDKPVANTYKALKSLEQKGAVISDNSTSKIIYETIPIEQFLNKLEHEFSRKKKSILSEAAELSQNQVPGGIYELKSIDIVYEKAVKMIKTSRSTIALDCYPAPMQVIKKDLDEVDPEKVMIITHKYDFELVDDTYRPKKRMSDLSLSEFRGQWMILIKDAEEALIAFFSVDGKEMLHSVWIQDPFISLILYNGLTVENNLIEMFTVLYDDAENKITRLRNVVRSFQPVYTKFIEAEHKILKKE
ncbi:TrmB family transcriptional regulator [Candidatus Cloacimonadota bacterium]